MKYLFTLLSALLLLSAVSLSGCAHTNESEGRIVGVGLSPTPN